MTMADFAMMDNAVISASLRVGGPAIAAIDAYRNHDNDAFRKAMKDYDVARLTAECAKRDIFDAVAYEAELASFGDEDG